MARQRQVEDDADGSLARSNAVFYASSNFVLYVTVAGIHVVELAANRVARVLGQHEPAERFPSVEVFDPKYTPRKPGAQASGEAQAAVEAGHVAYVAMRDCMIAFDRVCAKDGGELCNALQEWVL